MEDQELVIQLQKGDASAFSLLFERYQKQALRTAYFLSGNQSTAEDIVQEAFIQCFLQIHSLKDPGSFRSWFFKILTRLSWKISAKNSQDTPVDQLFESMENETNGEDAAAFLLRQESHLLLMEAVNGLQKKQRAVVVLYYYNQMTVSEIAKITGCLEGTVKSRLYFARKKLYEKLKADPYFGEKECELHEAKTH